MPKVEVLDYDGIPAEEMYSKHKGDNVASSSGSKIRSSLIGMGFAPALVDEAIEEKGEDNVDLLLEALFGNAEPKKPKSESSDSAGDLFCEKKHELAADDQPRKALHKERSESSDSLDSLFGDDKDMRSRASSPTDTHPKEELDAFSEVHVDKKASLLRMNFSLDEVEFAIDKLGESAPINELVDFIFAAQMAKNCEKDADDPKHGDEERKEGTNTEKLFGTMDKTLRLLEMGFSEHEISAAIDKYGSDVPIEKLADSIVTDQTGGICTEASKYSSTSFGLNNPETGNRQRFFGGGVERSLNHHVFDEFPVKTEDNSPNAASLGDFDSTEKYKGKRPKEEYIDEQISFKRPKEEFDDDLSSLPIPSWLEARQGISKFTHHQMPVSQSLRRRKAVEADGFGPKLSKPISCGSVDRMVAKPPYFFYGNVMNLRQDAWAKISQYLYEIKPEFVNSQFFSALSRKEGYIHNLPTENRFHILPKPPMTIEESIPLTRKYWPPWDTRKQLTCINSESLGISQYCNKIEKMFIDSRGFLSEEQQRDLLHQARALNLIWVGHNKLGPVEPEHLEQILGFPSNHTRNSEFNLEERLQSLRHCFQTDTLGYHVSALKTLFPEGLTLFSIYSGVGGAEITLHRLGIRLKGVVSIEPCEKKRRVLKKWWGNSGQSGELVQLEGIQRLTTDNIERLIKQFGGFDFLICQNPSYSAKSGKMALDIDSLSGLDFSLFVEFVRVLQRVRSSMERHRYS